MPLLDRKSQHHASSIESTSENRSNIETTTYHTQFNPVDGCRRVQYDLHLEHTSHQIKISSSSRKLAHGGRRRSLFGVLTRVEGELEEAAPNPLAAQTLQAQVHI